jgi:hypothetical protein
MHGPDVTHFNQILQILDCSLAHSLVNDTEKEREEESAKEWETGPSSKNRGE